MNNRIFFALVFLVLISVFFFILRGKEEIKNYPSPGTHIIAFGDSLVQGVGASSEELNFVSLLSKRIGKPIVNLGVSGNTTRDGLARISELDKYKPKVVLLLLGGNDYLRKVPEDETFRNLEKLIQDIQKRGSIVLLLGIRGGLLTDRFEQRFEELAEQNNTAYVSNVLSGLLTNEEYMADAIHPNDAGYRIISDRIYPVLKDLIK